MNGAVEVTDSVFNLAGYDIRAPLGTGQFGVVYRAWSAGLGTEVALKHIRAEGADGGIKIQAEERGADLQRRFGGRYPGLVPEIHECGRAANGDYYIAMELVGGRPLTELIRAARLEGRPAAELARAIADFLVKLHGLSDGAQPILHSDLKPEHVLVRDDGSLRILDLGIAKSLQANKSLTNNAWASAPYASPERLDDGQVRAGDDYWALGVMLYEMVAGYHPYHAYMGGDNNATLARAIRRTEPPAPLPPSTDPGLAAIIRKMIAPQPAHRYATAADIAADLDNYLEGRETVASAESAQASQGTQIIPQAETTRRPSDVALADTVPTEPVPVARVAAVAPATPASARRRRLSPFRLLNPFRIVLALRTRLGGLRPLARVALALFFIVVLLTESAAWMRAEQFRERIGGLQPSDVPAVRTELDRLRRLTVFGGGIPPRVRNPLRDHMVSLADRAILDFHNDLFVTEAQWKQAGTSLGLAAEIAPNDRSVTARLRYVEGHLARIASQGQNAATRQARLNEARSLFIEAARLDTEWPDPFLGLARISAYETRDFEALQLNIDGAQQRGYTPGRREQAQLGDAHRFRGDRARAQARGASGEGRRRFLEQAASDYEGCIAKFEGLDNYYESEQNLQYCRRQLERVREELGSIQGVLPFLFGILDADRRR
jgi:hypothetical protein